MPIRCFRFNWSYLNFPYIKYCQLVYYGVDQGYFNYLYSQGAVRIQDAYYYFDYIDLNYQEFIGYITTNY